MTNVKVTERAEQFYPLATSETPAPPPGKMLVQYNRLSAELNTVSVSLAGYCDKIDLAPTGSYLFKFSSQNFIDIFGPSCLRVQVPNFDYEALPGFEDWRPWVIATKGNP